MTWADEQQAIAYERAALNCGLDQTLDRFIERLTEARTEGWTRKRIKIVEFAARKGVLAVRELRVTLKKPAGGRTATERIVRPSCSREEL
jgi:hypothetical protein